MYETRLELEALLQNNKLSGVPILIFANKQDLVTAMPPNDITLELELHNIRNRAWQIQECSALTREGIQEGLHWMTMSLKA